MARSLVPRKRRANVRKAVQTGGRSGERAFARRSNKSELPNTETKEKKTLTPQEQKELNETLLREIQKVKSDDPICRGVQRALSQGADVNTVGPGGWTAMHWAARKGPKWLVGLLIADGANINVQTDDGWTPLMMALGDRRKDIATILINDDADLTAVSDQGATALTLAASTGSIELVTLMLDKGLDLNQANQGIKAYHDAWEHAPRNNQEICKLLKERGVDP